jgi:hypothetical protein
VAKGVPRSDGNTKRGNVTGLSNLGGDLAGKRIEFLRETLPRIDRLSERGG